MDKTNANVIHAALQLDTNAAAYDFGGAEKSGIGALKAALDSSKTLLLVQSDIRTGLPSSEDEGHGGDAASALIIGCEDDGDLIARYLGGSSANEEFIGRWRDPHERNSKSWEGYRFTTRKTITSDELLMMFKTIIESCKHVMDRYKIILQ